MEDFKFDKRVIRIVFVKTFMHGGKERLEVARLRLAVVEYLRAVLILCSRTERILKVKDDRLRIIRP